MPPLPEPRSPLNSDEDGENEDTDVSYEDVARLGLARRMDGGVWAWLGSEAAEASVRIEAKG
ncbi:hypothetical protein E1A91_D10G187300v1 [Gossypium mustelinum]|uniref:Uncharacterized protein n=1 Tax=Gossypium mustelinum TaxID=34275 RepID=A0A5D2T929_GOSMU|nr:hypothetical protein E1A91_D10G187300v1 [Gossypium mustelinum]